MSSRARSASRPARKRRSWSVGRVRSVASTAAVAGDGPRGSVAARRGSAGGAGPRPSPRRPRGSRGGPARRAAARPGPSRPRRTVSAAVSGTAPASEATATSRSRVTANAAGRSPLRSTIAPTRRPSAKTIAAGPSHGARNPAVRRRSVATCGCGARRRPSASGIAVEERRRRGPSRSRQQLEGLVERLRVGAVGDEQRPGGEELARRSPRRRDRAVRPRTCSRLPRTVLISPLWAIDRNGWASRQIGWVFVA